MHLFKMFFKLVNRNKTGLIIYGIITIVMLASLMMMVNSNAGDAAGISAEKKSYDISYIDNDDSELSKALVEYMDVNNTMTDYSDKNESEISNLVFFDITDFHMEIPEGFEEAIENGKDYKEITYSSCEGAKSYISYDIDSQVNGFIQAYQNYIKLGYDKAEAASKAKDLMTTNATLTVVSDTKTDDTNKDKNIVIANINQFYPYLILGMLTLGIGHTIIANNKKEISDRVNVGPVPGYMTQLINTLGLMVSGVIIWAIFMGINLIYGHDTEVIKQYGWVVALNSFVCMLSCCAITSLLTSLIKNSNILSMTTNIVGLSMSFFCGVFVPMRFIGSKVLTFAKFLPFYWTVYVNNMTYEPYSKYAFDLKQVIIGISIEFLFAVVLAAIALLAASKRIIKE
ncbi:MAG: ABC transporter permease [Saccharofermentans sp.]|nr:ABC transporter permease [Saccharofermentans sp.]